MWEDEVNKKGVCDLCPVDAKPTLKIGIRTHRFGFLDFSFNLKVGNEGIMTITFAVYVS